MHNMHRCKGMFLGYKHINLSSCAGIIGRGLDIVHIIGGINIALGHST